MAKENSTIEAVVDLEDILCQAQAVGEAVADAAGDACPPWLVLYRQQVEAIALRVDDVGRAVRAELQT